MTYLAYSTVYNNLWYYCLKYFNPERNYSPSLWEETEKSDFSRGEPLTLQIEGVHSLKPTI